MTSERSMLIQSEIQIEYRDPRTPHEPQLPPLRIICQQTANDVLAEAARACYT